LEEEEREQLARGATHQLRHAVTVVDYLGHVVHASAILHRGRERIDAERRRQQAVDDDIGVATEGEQKRIVVHQ
jgi:hypothetical protein